MTIREEAGIKISEGAERIRLSEEEKKEIGEKRNYFLVEFSKGKIAGLDKDHFFQGRGVQEGNFTYELEWNSSVLGSIRGGSVYKFGHEEDFEKIKKYLVKILSVENKEDQFYTEDGDLAPFSRELAKDSMPLKGVRRAFIGKVLSTYYPDIFIDIFGHQDIFLSRLYEDYSPETTGVELYLRNNFLLLQIKRKYAPQLSNYELSNYDFSHLLYALFDPRVTTGEETDIDVVEGTPKIDALEMDHYQSLIHRNFDQLFNGELRYFDPKRQNENKGHFDTEEVGIMDFLAVNNNSDLVIIELKRSSSDVTLGQILRYMGWASKNLCREGQKVKGVIVAESKNNRLDYALTIVPNVSFRKMTLKVEIEKTPK